MESLELAIKLVLLLAVWVVLAAPAIYGAFMCLRWLRKQGWQSVAAALALSTLLTLLVAPVPTPIITILVPGALAWGTGATYSLILSGHTWAGQILPWVIASHCVTFVVIFFVCRHFLDATAPCKPPPP